MWTRRDPPKLRGRSPILDADGERISSSDPTRVFFHRQQTGILNKSKSRPRRADDLRNLQTPDFSLRVGDSET